MFHSKRRRNLRSLRFAAAERSREHFEKSMNHSVSKNKTSDRDRWSREQKALGRGIDFAILSRNKICGVGHFGRGQDNLNPSIQTLQDVSRAKTNGSPRLPLVIRQVVRA